MQLFGAGLKPTETTALEVAADKASPDGRYLAISKTIPGHGVISFLDASTLKPTGAEIRDVYAWSIGDGRIAATATRSNKTIVILADGQHAPTEYETDCDGAHPQFVSSDSVALLGCGQVEVISVSGKKMMSIPLPGAPSYSAVASRSRARFAVSQQFERPGDPPSICAERITVFDIDLQKAIFVTENRTLEGESAGHSSGYALSPNGSLLAVSSAGRVQLFGLPK